MRPHEGGAQRLDLEVTDRCNANCVFCPRNEYVEKVGNLSDMRWPQFTHVIDETVKNFHPRFCNLGVFGEPTLWPYLPGGIKYLK